MLFRIVLLSVGLILLALQGFFPSADLLAVLSSAIWPTCFLYAVCKSENAKRSLLAYPFFCVGMILRYLFAMGTTPGFILCMMALSVLAASVLFLAFFFYGIAYRKLKSGFVTLVFPVLFFAVQLVFSKLVHMGNVTDPAVAIAHIPVLAQNAAWIGETGLCAVYTWMCAVLVYGTDSSRTKRARICLSAVCAAMLVFGFVFGAVRLTKRTDPADTIRVAVLTCDEQEFYAPIDPDDDEVSIRMFAETMKQITPEDADLIITNEEYGFFKADRFDEYLGQIRAVVAETHIPTLFCVGKYYPEGEDDPMYDNLAFLIDENGEVLCEYAKHNRILLIETGYMLKGDDKPAEVRLTLKGKVRNVAIAICFDLNDDLYMDQLSGDVDLILAPSWDWYNVNATQPRHTVLRAIEHNASLVKPTYCGISYAADAYGFITDSVSTTDKYEQAVFLEVPLGH